jgi:Flp pilus assembly protein TadG
MIRPQEESGQSIVEFALTASLLFFLLFAIMDGGRIMWSYVTVSQAANLTARYATYHGSHSRSRLSTQAYQPPGMNCGTHPGDALCEFVLASATGLDPAKLTVKVAWIPDNNPESLVTVTLAYEVAGGVTNFLWAGRTFSFSCPVTMIVQN